MRSNLAEIINISSLQELMESLWKASGIPVGIFDLEGRKLVAAGVQDLCDIFRCKYPALARLCPERDAVGREFPTSSPILREQQIREHDCTHGVVDISLPLFIQGRHLANLLLGKFLYEKPSRTALQATARGLGIDEREYVRAMRQIPVLSRARIEEILEFHIRLINLLVELGAKTLEQRDSEQALRQALKKADEARDRIDGILRSVADGLIVTDMNHQLVLINRPAALLLGVEGDQVLGKTLEEVLGCDAMKEPLDACCLEGDETAVVDLALTAPPSSSPRELQARISVMQNRNGRSRGMIILLRDITRERDLDRMKNEFVSTAAHELRTPLTSILGFAELLLEKNPVSLEQQDECLGYIYKSAQALEEIVDDLFVLSRFQAGETVHMEKVPCDLADKLGKLVEQYRAHCPGHQFILNLPHPMPPMIIDCEKIGQVLENLLSNAVKFSPGGGQVRVEGTLKAGLLRLTITDQGIGMTKEQLGRIFDKFYRADASNTAAPGLGLGMALAKNIIEAHGGTIQATSRPGEGTSITFTLPFTPSGDN